MEIKTSGTGWSAKLTPWITLMQGQITSQMGKLNPLPGRCKFYDQVLGFHVEDIEDVSVKTSHLSLEQIAGSIKDFTGGRSLREYLEESSDE